MKMFICLLFSLLLFSGCIEEPTQPILSCPNIDAKEIASNIIIPECPQQPSCPSTKASCTCPLARTVEACHIPDEYFSKSYERKTYTGMSNQPSIFMGNQLITVNVTSKKDLFVGCYYGFEHEEQEKVHRLIGIYSDYLLFRGDNSDGIEKVNFNDIFYLVRETEYR